MSIVPSKPAAVDRLVQAEQMLAEARTLAEAEHVRDVAAAARVYAKQARLGLSAVNHAQAIRILAEQRIAGLVDEGQDARSISTRDRHPGSVSVGDTAPATLADLGLTRQRVHEARALAAVPEEAVRDLAEQATTESRELTLTEVKRMGVHYSSSTPEWSTPDDLFCTLDAEFRFTTDVCATEDNAKCGHFYTEADDGLAQDWRGSCWMNPPYGDVIPRWVEKARATAEVGNGTVVALLPARVDTGWWWNNCIRYEIRFLRGRLKFGGGTMGAPFPSAVVVFAGPGREPDAKQWWSWK